MLTVLMIVLLAVTWMLKIIYNPVEEPEDGPGD
jgi:hypothetical protein